MPPGPATPSALPVLLVMATRVLMRVFWASVREVLLEFAAVSKRFCRAVLSSRGLAARRVWRTLLLEVLEDEEEGWGRTVLPADETVL